MGLTTQSKIHFVSLGEGPQKEPKALLEMLRSFFALLSLRSMCKDHDRLLVKWIPRYFNEVTYGMTEPYIFSTGAQGGLGSFVKRTTFDFSVLKVRPQSLPHKVNSLTTF